MTVRQWHGQGVQAGVRVREIAVRLSGPRWGPARELGWQLASRAALAWVFAAGHQHISAVSSSGTV